MTRTITAAGIVAAGAAVVGVAAVAIAAGALAIAAVAALVAAIAAVVIVGALLAIGTVLAAGLARALARRSVTWAARTWSELEAWRLRQAELRAARALVAADAEVDGPTARRPAFALPRWQPRRMAVLGALSSLLLALLLTGAASARIEIPRPNCESAPNGCVAPPADSNANPDAGGPPPDGAPGLDGNPGRGGGRP